MIGIYMVRNKINKKVYIGKSSNIEKRFKQHKDSLKRGKHANKKLQKDYDDFGEKSFEFEVVLQCDHMHLDRNESLMCYKYDVWNERKGYNTAKLLDYRKISHEDAIELKDNFLERLHKSNRESIKKNNRIKLYADWIANRLNVSVDVMVIALKEITFDDEQKYNWSINVCNETTRMYIDVFDQDYMDSLFLDFCL